MIWNSTHLGKRVRIKGNKKNVYILEAMIYDSGNGSIRASLIQVEPFYSCINYDLDSLELITNEKTHPAHSAPPSRMR